MDARNEIQDPFAISRMLPAERSQWQQRVVREARTAQAAAVGELLVRVVAVMFRGVSVLVSIFRGRLPVGRQRRFRGLAGHRPQ
jgi:hypothetical protein